MHISAKYLIIGAMGVWGLFSVPEAKAQGVLSPICMKNSIIPYCATPTAYAIAANGSQNVSVNNGASYILLQVTSGTATVSSSGALGNIPNVSGSAIGNATAITQTFGVGSYYIIINGQTSFSVNSVNGASVEVGQVTNAPSFVDNNVANLGKNIESSLINSQGNSQVLASVLASTTSNGSGIGTLTTNLNNEVSRATGVEQGLQTSISNEVTRATGVEKTLIPSNDINAPLGVAGLDSGGNMTSFVATPLMTGAPMTSSGQQPLINVGRFPVYPNIGAANAGDPFQSPDALYVGGLPTQGWNAATGFANNSTGRPGSIVLTGQPWGPYNAGSIESILWGNGVDQQNGIANVDWRNGNIPPFDGVAQYIGVTNTQALIVAPASFAVGQVTISPALTSNQLSQLRVGMYISTNIINSQVSTTGPTDWIGTGYPIANYYQGIISGWSQTTNSQGQAVTVITVPAWDSYDFTTHSTTSIPGNQTGDSIDTVRSNYGTPMVFIGNDVGEAAHNDFITYSGSNANTTANGGHATALSHAMGDNEIDFRYYATHTGEVEYTGITMSTQPIGGSPMGSAALTSNSYFLNLSGDMPNLLILDGAANNNIIQSHSFYLHGQEGSFFPSGSTTGQSGTRQIQTNFAFTDYADSTDSMNLIGYQIGYGTGTGYSNTSYHFGLQTNGSIMQPTTSGYNQGEIEWNPKGTNAGSIALCAINENCGLIVDGNGNAHSPNGTILGGKVTFAAPGSSGVSTYTTEDDAANLTFHASNGAGSFANLFAATFNATGYITVQTSGLSAGNGFTLGQQPSGHAAALGIYALQGYQNSLVEIINGNTTVELLDASGNLTTAGGYTSGGNITTAAGGNVTFTSPDSSGVSAYTTVDDGANLTFHATNAPGSYANLKASNFTATGGFFETLTTPSSSSDTCTVGQFTDDANYHYVCIATNTWKKSQLEVWPTTFASLPASPFINEKEFCTDCYSPLRSSGVTATGIQTVWNGSNWTDAVGNPVNHP